MTVNIYVFAVIENPMEAKGVIHTQRKGNVTIRVRGLRGNPPVYDLCGDDPDPHRLSADEVTVDGEMVTINLNWQHGDSRLFWIDTPLPPTTQN